MAKSKSKRAPVKAKRTAKKAAQTRSAKARKSSRKPSKPKSAPARGAKAAAKPSKKVAKKVTTAPVKKAAVKKAATKKAPAGRAAAPAKTAPRKAANVPMRRPPSLDRERRTVRDTESVPTPPSSLDMDRSASAARTGRAELNERIREHTSTSPAMTAGDVDADWESAESVGDEAPGGDNPTPDQDVVDDIGRALGVEYDDDEELQGGDEIRERDQKRWELDPASSDDFDDR